MERLFVNPKYARTFTVEGSQSFAGIVAHFLPGEKSRPNVTVQRVTVPAEAGAVDAFFKLYDHAKAPWRFWLRASKARREFVNYGTFAELAVPAAEAIACGEERDALGRLQRAFILTHAVPGASTLLEFFATGPTRNERAAILSELAGLARRMHAANFFYYDLVWRNILVSREDGRSPRLFFIDCPRGSYARFGRTRRRLRDLASLDKSASQFCSRAERLRFLQAYLGEQELNEEVRSLARACLEYRRKRWPEDWRGE